MRDALKTHFLVVFRIGAINREFHAFTWERCFSFDVFEGADVVNNALPGSRRTTP